MVTDWQPVFRQRVMERVIAATDFAKAPLQPGSFRMLIFIHRDFHPATEQTQQKLYRALLSGRFTWPGAHRKCL